MKRQGHQAFAGELAQFAAGLADDRVTAIAKRLAEPLKVAVHGRQGVGCRTVAKALWRVGTAFQTEMTSDSPPDLYVYVVAEAVKPEDIAAVAAVRIPLLAVLNKADLLGFAGDGPIARARLQSADCSARLGVPMEPMVGLLGVLGDISDDLSGDLDETLWTAIGVLAADPAALDAFCLDGLAAAHPLPAGVRSDLLDTLDVFGTAIAVAAARRGGTRAQIRAILRRISRVDAVIDKLADLGAHVHYQRVLDAVAELEAVAVSDERISAFLTSDDVVLARMACAEDVVCVSGSDDRQALLPRAVQWQRHARGPVSALHRACSADITRGSLRLWSREQKSHLAARESP